MRLNRWVLGTCCSLCREVYTPQVHHGKTITKVVTQTLNKQKGYYQVIWAALIKLGINIRYSALPLTLQGTISYFLTSELGVALSFALPQDVESWCGCQSSAMTISVTVTGFCLFFLKKDKYM